ncbi:hypothetical protein EON65_52405 [archaeon]|nr:MAG: hypothetical protein EON65_52405 [archaeon]
MSICMIPSAMLLEPASRIGNVPYAASYSPMRPRAHSTTSMDANNFPDFCLTTASQTHHRLTLEFSLEDHIKKTRKAASYLRQLVHTKSCQGVCQQAACLRVLDILNHANACSNMACLFPGCNTTKTLVQHMNTCTSNTPSCVRICLLCSIAKTPRNLPAQNNNYKHTYIECDGTVMVYDEMIEVSKVPFQTFMQEIPTPHRAKTFSESHVYETSAEGGVGGMVYGGLEFPSKKLRY